MNYLIVDDEPIAQTIIEGYCKDLPFMEHVASCDNALSALEILQQRPVDLIFLDVEMPRLDGFAMLRSLTRPPAVIVVSAHREYALEGYDLNVVDYLLKPFGFDRFLKALNKARATVTVGTGPEATLFVKDGKKHHQIAIAEIVYVEARANYAMVVLEDRQILINEKISDLEKRLGGTVIRVHKSYLVALRKIRAVLSDEIDMGERRIPVGRTYKAAVAGLTGST